MLLSKSNIFNLRNNQSNLFTSMKILKFILLISTAAFLFTSCRNKTVVLLTKKWDCVQLDNIVPPDQKFLSKKDSVNADQLKTLLQSLSWTFKNNMRYECSINGRVTVEGKYELLEDDKIMKCTPKSGTIVNQYIIKSLTENELTLIGNADNSNVILHFQSVF